MLKSKSNGISKLQRPFLIGVTGGTSSGKKSVCEKIVQQLEEVSVLNGSRKVAIIRQDSFYNTLNKEEMVLAEKCQYNFDHPDAFDTELMINTISDISQGKKVYVPKYDVKANSRMLKGEFTEVSECDVVLFVGILTFYHKEIRDLLHMKIFVDCDADTRLSRAVLRDTSERGKHLETVLQKYTNFVKPAFEGYCLPTKKFADIIIPRGVENTVAINLIVQHLRDVLCGGGGHTPLVKKNGDSEEDR